jgi:hypothetical protein
MVNASLPEVSANILIINPSSHNSFLKVALGNFVKIGVLCQPLTPDFVPIYCTADVKVIFFSIDTCIPTTDQFPAYSKLQTGAFSHSSRQ